MIVSFSAIIFGAQITEYHEVQQNVKLKWWKKKMQTKPLNYLVIIFNNILVYKRIIWKTLCFTNSDSIILIS